MANAITNTFNRLFNRQATTPEGYKKNLNYYLSPVQLERIRQNTQTWRDCVTEAELAWYPHRVKMQRLFQDTVLNGHVIACLERRKDMTLLRDYVFETNGVVNDDLTQKVNTKWFKEWMEYGLDALAYGYQLVAHGDLIEGGFPTLSIVKRQNISPDRLNVGTYVYSIDGVPFLEEPYLDWHSYFSTPSQNGASLCGYGYLYPVALYEIFLRNLTGANADYIQTFGQPYRIGKTSKTEENERNQLLQSLLEMGASNAIVIDPEDDIQFLSDSSSSSTGHSSYDNFETRCEKKISKIILGHSDAVDSVAGKLGASQDGDNSPVAKALRDKKIKDGEYIENAVNNILLPKLIRIGFDIPIGTKFKFKNDDEVEALRKKEDDSNQITANIMKTISDAGGEPDWSYFEERTGIKVEKKAIVTPNESIGEKAKSVKSVIENMQNMWRK